MKKYWLIGVILVFAGLSRLYNLGYPDKYYFDEVYHAVTAKAYARNNPAGYEWWHSAPEPGTAYEWLHPPLAKLLMAGSIRLFGETAWAWRFPGAIMGVGVVWLTYLLGYRLTKKRSIGLMAAGFASLDGLLLTQSRIGMNDIYVTFFILAAVLFYGRGKLWWSGLMTGLAVSTKWSGVFILLMILFWELAEWRRQGLKWWRRVPRLLMAYVGLTLVIYGLSYGQFWLQGHTVGQFKELHQQIWWYQTNLEATHSYQSKAWEWPLMLRPVWYFVDYLDDGRIANIYDLANPFLLWLGLAAQIGMVIELMRGKTGSTTPGARFWMGGYWLIWVPWLLSPRIMFFYHFTPAIPFLALGLAAWLEKYKDSIGGRQFIGVVTICLAAAFVWWLPIWIGWPLTSKALELRFWLPTWK